MGNRKSQLAARYREERAMRSYAVLRNCPLSARKVRLVADTVRGVEVNRALGILRFTERNSAPRLEKLLLSALANWQSKNNGRRPEEANLFVEKITVDEGRSLKRIRPRAQGRAGRILKRSCHVYIEVAERDEQEEKNTRDAVHESQSAAVE